VRRAASESPACALDRARASAKVQELQSREVIDHMVVKRANARRTMLLCAVKGLDDISMAYFSEFRRMRIVPGWGWLLGDGQDRDGPLVAEGKLLLGHVAAGWNGAGTADESFEGQQGCGSRLAGQAVPGAGRQSAAARS
jgi:hypothetical protein